jgi:hypothetical protein
MTRRDPTPTTKFSLRIRMLDLCPYTAEVRHKNIYCPLINPFQSRVCATAESAVWTREC